ncbi:MAG: hypothetical protein M1535_02980 [Candidatus Thermoplasmatota archaeon]|jgi:hypothetical protein|nr:hypothetical protein [Candidatus Thermoplasmatota archaeon]
MGKLGIYTSNPRFYYGVIRTLKDFGINYKSIESIEDDVKIVDGILSYTCDQRISTRQIFSENPVQAVRRGLAFFLNLEKFGMISIGIDPGPKPGIAVTTDNIVLEAFELYDIQQIRETVETILEDYVGDGYSIRIGDGDAPNRQYILRQLRSLGVNIEIINESGTSFPHKTHDNALSAARIANIELFLRKGPAMSVKKRKELISEEFQTVYSM